MRRKLRDVCSKKICLFSKIVTILCHACRLMVNPSLSVPLSKEEFVLFTMHHWRQQLFHHFCFLTWQLFCSLRTRVKCSDDVKEKKNSTRALHYSWNMSWLGGRLDRDRFYTSLLKFNIHTHHPGPKRWSVSLDGGAFMLLHNFPLFQGRRVILKSSPNICMSTGSRAKSLLTLNSIDRIIVYVLEYWKQTYLILNTGHRQGFQVGTLVMCMHYCLRNKKKKE